MNMVRAMYPIKPAVAATARNSVKKKRTKAAAALLVGSIQLIIKNKIPHAIRAVINDPRPNAFTVIIAYYTIGGPDGSRTRCLLRDRETCKTVTLQAQYYIRYRIICVCKESCGDGRNRTSDLGLMSPTL